MIFFVYYAALVLATSSITLTRSLITALIEPTIPEAGESKLAIIPAINSSLDGSEAKAFS